MSDVDLLIVGGGIVSLCLAKSLTDCNYSGQLAILEGGAYLGDETTGRNSGVLHAGIYYPKDSLKHLLCIRGNELWRHWASQSDLEVKVCGKFIVASGPSEAQKLESVYKQAKENQVFGIRKATSTEIAKLNEDVYVHDGIFSPLSGIINVGQVVKKISDELFKKDIPILKNHKVLAIKKINDEFHVQTENEILTAKSVVNLAGLGAVTLRKTLGLSGVENKFVKGSYLKCKKKIKSDQLVYPVPEEDLRGLGVHLTFDWENNLRFGPDACEVNSVDYSISEQTLKNMLPAILKLYRNINEQDLSLDFAGVRPKIVVNNNLYKDFWIKGPKDLGIEGYYECLGIESPGLTSAPAIAEYMIKNFNLV